MIRYLIIILLWNIGVHATELLPVEVSARKTITQKTLQEIAAEKWRLRKKVVAKRLGVVTGITLMAYAYLWKDQRDFLKKEKVPECDLESLGDEHSRYQETTGWEFTRNWKPEEIDRKMKEYSLGLCPIAFIFWSILAIPSIFIPPINIKNKFYI